MTDTLEARFWVKVQRGDAGECWPWLASKFRSGYGSFGKKRGATVYAHRMAYELMRGPIPKGLHIDHLCRNRACVNPSHMEAVTPAENSRRGALFAGRTNLPRTHCPHGHEWTESNTANYGGGRVCRACYRVGGVNYSHKRVAA